MQNGIKSYKIHRTCYGGLVVRVAGQESMAFSTCITDIKFNRISRISFFIMLVNVALAFLMAWIEKESS